MNVERFQFTCIVVQKHARSRNDLAVLLNDPEFAAMRAKIRSRFKQMSFVALGIEDTIIFGIDAGNQIVYAVYILWNGRARAECAHLRFSVWFDSIKGG